ncbi:MAG: hypothetical protein WCY32_14530 [Burkholderiaceae bacterium]
MINGRKGAAVACPRLLHVAAAPAHHLEADMRTWYERAEDEIDQQYADGLIDSKEYQHQMRELRAEMRSETEEAAREAYNNAMGEW